MERSFGGATSLGIVRRNVSAPLQHEAFENAVIIPFISCIGIVVLFAHILLIVLVVVPLDIYYQDDAGAVLQKHLAILFMYAACLVLPRPRGLANRLPHLRLLHLGLLSARHLHPRRMCL